MLHFFNRAASCPELLETRIAPAAVFVNSRKVTYTDLDGDRVSISCSAPIFSPLLSNLDFSDGPAGTLRLESIQIPASAQRATLVIQSTPGPSGDGLVNVGWIDATGVDLKSVVVDGDLGQIDAGDNNLRTAALGSISMGSMGLFGALYGAPGSENRSSDLRGSVGTVKILNDLHGAALSVSGDATLPASIASLYIGGDLAGTADSNTGRVGVDGAIGSVFIGGSLRGGEGSGSGSIQAGLSIGSLTVRGSVEGSSGDFSGSIRVGTNLRNARIGRDLSGGAGMQSGLLELGLKSKSILIGGGVLGGAGDNSGRILSGDDIDLLHITLDLRGASGDQSGTVDSGDDIDALNIGGSISGGRGDDSGGVRADGNLKAVRIGGSIIGASLPTSATSSTDTSGYLRADNFGTVSVLGSIVAGENKSPSVHVTLTGDLANGSTVISGLTDTSALRPGLKVTLGDFNSKVLSVDSSSQVTLEDPFPASSVAAQNLLFTSPTLTASGIVYARETIGSISITGNLMGSTTNQAQILARGIPDADLNLRATTSVAISKLLIRGLVSDSLIGAGIDSDGVPVNPDAQIGTIQILGSWVRSSLVAGISPGADGFYGSPDDATATPGANYNNRPKIISRIAAIVIGGQVVGSQSASDRFGFVANQIGSLNVSGTKLPIRIGPAPASFTLSPATEFDAHLREIPHHS